LYATNKAIEGVVYHDCESGKEHAAKPHGAHHRIAEENFQRAALTYTELN
jgi:hypothetical protein